MEKPSQRNMGKPSVFGINTSGKDVKFKNKNRDHDDNPVVTALMKNEQNEKEEQINMNVLKEFGDFLKKQDLVNYFKDIEEKKEVDTIKKKGKKATISKKDMIKINLEKERVRNDTQKLLSSLQLVNFYPLKKNKLRDSFLNIIFWAVSLIKQKKNENISLEVYFDCSISLYRSFRECSSILNDSVHPIILSILNDLKHIIEKKDKNNIYVLFEKYYYLINSSFWDKNKPNAITLYSEQQDAITYIMEAVTHDKPLLLFYWVPPANGKTLVSVIIAKRLAEYCNSQQKQNPSFRRKTLLYICYNEIVRNSVESLCLTHNVDVKFWLATYRKDMYKEHYFVRFRPDKSCFPDHIKVKTKELRKKDKINEVKRFSPDIREQMLQYLDETRFVKDRMFDVQDVETAPNLPEMIISDLDSAYFLLKEFPDTFVPYFDEAFAASNQMITSKIMSVLPKISVLVSATLATKEQIPVTLNHYKTKHNANDDDINYIYSSKQHINCQFMSPDGYIISPHHNLNSCNEIDNFIGVMKKHPLIQRGYCNLIVLEMVQKLKDILPSELKLNTLFEHYGSLTNEKIRNYGIRLLEFCSKNDEYFQIIKQIQIHKIKDNTILNIFTKNAYVYQDDNTLHVSNPENYGIYIEELVKEFLKDSPKLKKMMKEYENQIEVIQKEIDNIEKNSKSKTVDKEYEINEVKSKLSSVSLSYPSEFIMNSNAHSQKFRKANIQSPQKVNFYSHIVNNFNDTMAKLFLSNIGVYNQTTLDSFETEVFLNFKDHFKFILSDPSIIYGTNINLTMIDVHENMSQISTRNTLYQLIGRAGRRGKSSSANVIFRNWDLFNIVVQDNDDNIEAMNIENNLMKLLE